MIVDKGQRGLNWVIAMDASNRKVYGPPIPRDMLKAHVMIASESRSFMLDRMLDSVMRVSQEDFQ